MVWNQSLCSRFFEAMSELNNASTMVNFHNALISVRTYLRRVDKAPQNSANLAEDFRDMQLKAIKNKRIYVNQRKESKKENTSKNLS